MSRYLTSHSYSSFLSEDEVYNHMRNISYDLAFDFLSKNQVSYFPVWGVSQSKLHGRLICDCRHGASCNRTGKHPFSKETWSVLAYNNEIVNHEEWFWTYPNGNLAVCTGLTSELEPNRYLVVVDIDSVPEGATEEECDWVGGNHLPSTFEYKTGGGGKHLWFWSDKPIACSVKKLSRNVDIRGMGGYAIVPPSCHVSGKHYMADDSVWETPIANIPVWLQEKLIELGTNEVQQSQKKERVTHTVSKSDILTTSPLARLSVANLRRRLVAGEKIPDGMRNNTILRLLGSDRATCGCEFAELLEKARFYRDAWCESPQTIPDSQLVELATTVSSYAKGFASQDYSMVNVNYVSWMQAKFKESLNKSITLERLQKYDDEFFSKMLKVLEPCGITRIGTPKYEKLMTLAEIATCRESFMYTSGLGTFSKYRSQFLAKKLEELGAVRVRTSKGNLWNISMSEAYEARLGATVAQVSIVNNCLTDSFRCATLRNQIQKPREDVCVNSSHLTTLATTTHMTIKTTSTNEIKFSRKDHPSERRYVGFSCYETQNAVNQCLEILEGDEFTQMFQGTLIYDEDGTAEFFDEIKVGDIVGLVTHDEGGGWIPRQYKVLETKVDGLDKHLVENRFGEEKTQREITFEQVSIALLLGYAEILKRDDKPYGLSADQMELKIVFNVPEQAEGKDLDEAVADVPVAEATEPVEQAIQSVLGKMEQELVEAGFSDVDNGTVETDENHYDQT